MKAKQFISFIILLVAGYFIYSFGNSSDAALLKVNHKSHTTTDQPAIGVVRRNHWTLN